MDLKKSIKDFKIGAGKLSTVASDGMKSGSDALNEAKEKIRDREPQIGGKIGKAVAAGGRAMEKSGQWISGQANGASKNQKKLPGQETWIEGVRRYAVDALNQAGALTESLGTSTTAVAPLIGATVAGAVAGVSIAVADSANAVGITDRDFEAVKKRILRSGPIVKAEIDRKTALVFEAQKNNRKKDLLDLYVVGGVSLTSIIASPDQTPADIERAFTLAYPGLSEAGESFADVADRLPAEDLFGLVNGVKGKLFETQLVDHLNDGNLQNGFTAELAGSATQPGYDIQIFDQEGHVSDILQAKATESVAYVKDAIEQYPGIDVATTTEVYAQLLAAGVTDSVSNSGISEQLLQQKVEVALASDDFDITDIIPSSLGLALIALSSFMDGSLTLEQQGAEFGDRAAKASVAGATAAAVLMASNTWWLALAAGVGSRSLISYGGNKRARYQTLVKVAEILETRARSPEPPLL